ncbi:hypothetical protein [Sphingomonas sp.]|jgi:hypothetical protein|uniref:hypothetical protein n=1 Tax=Sphingomonas sp. TaxID=28214 RepID=UPI002DE62481|nr:hypothetical protein [Sphingomonas sp.]
MFVGNWLLKNKWALSKLLASTPARLHRALTKDELFNEPLDQVVQMALKRLQLDPIAFEIPDRIVLKHEADFGRTNSLYSYVQKSKGSHQLWTQYPHGSYVPILRGKVFRKGIVIKLVHPRVSIEHNPIREHLQLVQKALLHQQDQVDDFNYVLPIHIERALFRYRQFGARMEGLGLMKR